MERVLVVPQGVLSYIPEGVSTRIECIVQLFCNIKRDGFFMNRDQAEVDTSYRQIIPYVTLVTGDRVFSYQRSKSGGESRLWGLTSLGIGGHVNEVDAYCVPYKEGMVCQAALREVNEEVTLDRPIGLGDMSVKGIINDMSNDVGKVHLGVFLNIDAMAIKAESLALSNFRVLSIDGLDEEEGFETWSELIIPYIGSYDE